MSFGLRYLFDGNSAHLHVRLRVYPTLERVAEYPFSKPSHMQYFLSRGWHPPLVTEIIMAVSLALMYVLLPSSSNPSSSFPPSNSHSPYCSHFLITTVPCSHTPSTGSSNSPSNASGRRPSPRSPPSPPPPRRRTRPPSKRTRRRRPRSPIWTWWSAKPRWWWWCQSRRRRRR